MHWYQTVAQTLDCTIVCRCLWRVTIFIACNLTTDQSMSTVVQLTNRLLRSSIWADGGFVYYKRVSSPSFLVSSRLVYNNIVVCNRAG